MSQQYQLIKSLTELKKLATDKVLECFILLNGIARSSKNIRYNKKTKIFEVHNEIDDTIQFLTEKELFTDSNIGKAIRNRCFYKY